VCEQRKHGSVGAGAGNRPGYPTGPARCAPDPGAFQQACIDAFGGSQVAQGFSQITIDNGTGVLERFLALADRPAWEITEHDVDRVIAALVKRGVTQTTRRGYVQAFRNFFGFLEARKAVEIEALFGCRLRDPLDRFNSARHVSSETPGLVPPPTVERVDAFFDFLRDRLETARTWAPAARDYALFRTLYHAGLRAQEAATLEIRDVHFSRGPFGKLHVRLGKGARGSGPRPRWVPMLDQLDELLRWYLAEARPLFREKGPVLFCDQSGEVMAFGTIRNRLAYLQRLEGAPVQERFSPHALRRACATRNYERGVDLVAIQQMLGHWHVGTTMRYVQPSSTFVEDAYVRAVSDTLAELEQEKEN
jgi:integrase/recombinase XerD